MTGEEFVAWFEAYWAAPEPERLAEVAHPDARFVQPLMAAETLAGHQASLRRLLAVMPDLHSTVERWAAQGDHVFIEHTLAGTLGALRLEWRVADRITLRDGRLAERVAWFDPLPLLARVALRPQHWIGVGRALLGR